MPDDYPIIPAGGRIPVTVRRPPGQPDQLSIPQQAPQQNPNQQMPQPAAAPPPQVIYINNQPPAPAYAPQYMPPPQPAPQIVQEHHHHHHNVVVNRLRIPQVRGAGVLGGSSIALGFLACLICWIPSVGIVAVPLAAIGVALGILGTLAAIVFRRSSVGSSIGGIVLCCVAAAIAIGMTKPVPYWQSQLHNALPPSVNQIVPAPSPPAASSAPKSTPPPAPVDPATVAATKRLMDVEKTAADRAKATPEYQKASTDAAAAHAQEDYLQKYSPGSAALMDASKAMIDADNAKTAVLENAIANDPDVKQARATLAEANRLKHMSDGQ